ncbi:MAG: pantoate--beta-alanine ligase [Cryomorphaceae bacterium]|jgi:pantoate--beta-alanine ligase
MIRLHSDTDIQKHCQPTPAPLVLVPTMGALHEGHSALIAKAKELAGEHGHVVVSIFVNPIQFDRVQDLESYPQPIEKDLKHCEALGVDFVYTPKNDDFYFPNRSIEVSENALSSLLCGATRPGHFDGVCTVITKLFNILNPTAAVFGQKDYQQLAIIKRLVRDLSYRTEIIAHPTVRELSGLAISSRNVGLTDAQLTQASAIREGLQKTRELYVSGVTSADRILSKFRLHLDKCAPLSKIDYLECVCADSLQALSEVDKPAVIATAVFFGQVRLIDNIML